MMALGVYAILILGAFHLGGCCETDQNGMRGSGNVIEESRDLGHFSGVALMTVGNLEIEIGDREELHIEVEDNLLAMIETKIVDDMLEIKHRGNADSTKRHEGSFVL